MRVEGGEVLEGSGFDEEGYFFGVVGGGGRRWGRAGWWGRWCWTFCGWSWFGTGCCGFVGYLCRVGVVGVRERIPADIVER